MKKTDYKLFFYVDDNPININVKNYNYNSQQNNEMKSKLFHQDNQKNMYNKVKQKYDFYLKRNKNILLLNKKSTSGKITSKDYLENIENCDKEIKKDGLSLLPFVPNKKENHKKIEELKKLQRNTVTMRRIEYSMKVKNATNFKKRYNTKKIIIIQKWVRGFLLRNLLSNLSDFEVFKNEFIDHFKKFAFLKFRQDMNNIIKYFENKIIKEDAKHNSYNINENNNDNNIENSNNKNEECYNNKDNKDIYNKGEAMSFGDNLNNNINKKSLDVIKENSNERYIDEDSIMEYNNRNKNNNNNILFLSSKDFSEKNLMNSNNNYNNNSSNLLLISNNNNTNNNIINGTPFVLNESSIMYEETNKKNEKIDNNSNNNSNTKKNIKNDTLNSNKDDIFSTLKNEEVRDVFNAKHSNNLVTPSPVVINNIINNENDINSNKDLFIRRPKLNRKFIEEISSAQSSTPVKKENNNENNQIDESTNIFKKIESQFMENNKNEEKKEDIINNQHKNKIMMKEKSENILQYTKNHKNEKNVKINNYIEKDIKELDIYEDEKSNKYIRKINHINSMKSNQFGSISNPTNTTKENSTLDSNTLNINRKLVLDENISIINNNKTVLEHNINIIKPINKPMIITKIRLCQKQKVEYLIIKFSKSEKKNLPKIFDLNYQYSQEITEEENNNNIIINHNNEKNNDINKEDNNANINNNLDTDNNVDNVNIDIIDNNNNDIDINKSISNDININVLNVVNNNVDELNSSIKNIVKESIPIIENNQNKLTPFAKSIRALLDLNKPIDNNTQNNKINENENENEIDNNDDIDNDKINEEKEEINMDINNNNYDNKESPLDVINQMSIEEIKEVKEEYEEEKESELNFTQKKLYNSNDVIESSKEIDNILDSNKNLIKTNEKNIKNNEIIICSQNICFSIISPILEKKQNFFDKSQIFFVILLGKQIKFNVKPYIFNLLKKLWIEKLKN